jgi:hypothetical protein
MEVGIEEQIDFILFYFIFFRSSSQFLYQMEIIVNKCNNMDKIYIFSLKEGVIIFCPHELQHLDTFFS